MYRSVLLGLSAAAAATEGSAGQGCALARAMAAAAQLTIEESAPQLQAQVASLRQRCSSHMREQVSDLPCNVRREGGQSLVIGGPSLVILEGKACNPL